MFENTVNLLIDWFIKNKRDLPWRHTTDPYKIWISEIILQQTRVEQGLPYYNKFIQKYPTVQRLAKAVDDEVMKLWQGLGYYSRARNLLSTARELNTRYKNKFPQNYEAIKSLKGIGDYTAAAIASFAFNLNYPVLDGNVYRFITRLYGIESPIDKAETKKAVMALLHEMMAKTSNAATFNQALMEFGALQCVPKNPDCTVCPFRSICIAFNMNQVDLLPVKGKAVKVRTRYLNYFIFLTGKQTTFIKKRTARDVWQNLYDFPLIETESALTLKKIMRDENFLKLVKNTSITSVIAIPTVLHKLTHQNLYVSFYIVNITKFLNLKKSPIFEIEINTINSFAVPRVIEKFLHSINFKLI